MVGEIYSLTDSFKQIVLSENFIDTDGVRKTIVEYFCSIGMQYKRALFLCKQLVEDLSISKESSSQKIWALERGFIPGRIELYGLNDNNWNLYLSDYDYFKIHPINNHFAIWINDKITLKYMLQKPMLYKGQAYDIMPEYYLYIENDGRYSYLMDAPEFIAHDEDFIFNLVREKEILAMKPSNGAGGFGFVKLEYKNSAILFNDSPISKEEWDSKKSNLQGYIITEYVKQHKDLDLIWPNSVCTLRVIAGKNWYSNYKGGSPEIFVSYARFGSSKSNGASNLSAGGFGVPFDYETGEYQKGFFRYQKYSVGESFYLNEHPDTHYNINDKKLPHADLVRATVLHVCNLLSSLEYFGFDIMITDNAVKLCEINSHPSMDLEQVMCGPIFSKDNASKFFNDKISKQKCNGL